MRIPHLVLVTFTLVPLSALALPLAAGAQSADPLYTATPQQLDVVKVIIKQQDAWNKGDLDGYLSHYKDAPDTQAVLASLVRGLNNIRAAYRQNFPSRDAMGNIEDTDVEVRMLGDNFALATGRYHLTRSKKAGGPAEGTFSELFEKTSAGWQ